ncbi:translation initiation factor IF-2 [Notolabrus celidotus]|uniref:translation initiation factor IF-2 n=1 Tax=Notolabrus celidotus TaxID=1203425 RepID=UPI00148F5A63|nr:translation initiation factor IF-2 [Notolabrus celidotus]
MMSYLWILLLGSLLAASAKAQDDAAPTEEATALETTEEPTPEADAAVESSEDTAADEETEETSEELSPPEPETTEDPTEEPESTADPEPTAEAEEVTPAADDDADSTTPEEEEEEEEALTTVATDIEEDAETTPAVPAADPETPEPEADQPASKEEASKATTPPPKKSGADPDAEDSEEEPTDPVAPVPTIKPNVVAPEENSDLGFNLEDALAEGPAVENPAKPGKSRSMETGPQAAEATGDVDKPDAQEASSGSLAGILSAVVIAAVGGVAAYITYQKKKLCFKNRQEADPEAARKADTAEAQSDPQVLSNLLNSS